jgi:hypothetical protein
MYSQVGFPNYIGDGFYFRILRCDHGILNLENLVQLAENNMKLALILRVRITEECFFPSLILVLVSTSSPLFFIIGGQISLSLTDMCT